MKTKIAYYVGTGLLTALMLMSAGMYLFNNAEVSEVFTRLGYPTYIIYPLATAKLLGLAAIWSGFSTRLRYMAYAGFFFNFILAASAHFAAGDGEAGGAIMALAFLGTSYWTRSRLDAVAPASEVRSLGTSAPTASTASTASTA